MPDVNAFVHQWLILRLLTVRGPGRSLQELASEYSVSMKTIRRDFEALQRVGFAFTHTSGRHN